MPMTRGMEVACYVRLQGGATVADLRTCLEVRPPHGPPVPPAGASSRALGALHEALGISGLPGAGQAAALPPSTLLGRAAAQDGRFPKSFLGQTALPAGLQPLRPQAARVDAARPPWPLHVHRPMQAKYKDETFVRLLPPGAVPQASAAVVQCRCRL
jgi:hypothetical protein